MRLLFLILTILLAANARAAEVAVIRVPPGGFKASAAVDATGALHLAYFSGPTTGGDVFYVTSRDGGATFSPPLRVNSQPGSALGGSSARGPHLALGRERRVHLLWPGSTTAQPRGPLNPAQKRDSPHNGTPLLYTRLDDAHRAFAPQQNLLRRTTALDGDSSLAADGQGRVYAVWHALPADGSATGEAGRTVWLARSDDDGATFAEETNVLPEPTGACGCCGLTASAAADGRLAILYRVAIESTHRGERLLLSRDRGATFTATQLDDWKLMTCPMSTGALVPARGGFLGAWENAGRISLSPLPVQSAGSVSGSGANRKHPALAVNSHGETLLAWTENISFGRGGDVAWQRYDAQGKPLGEPGHAASLPAHGNLAAVAFADGRFAVIY